MQLQNHKMAARVACGTTVPCAPAIGRASALRNKLTVKSSSTQTGSKPAHSPRSEPDDLEARRAIARESMEWFRVPPKVYFKGGCLEVALNELRGKKRAFIVTDKVMFDMDFAEKITQTLDDLNVQHQVFYHVAAEPSKDTLSSALRELTEYKPDVIIAIGGGAPMDAAKAMWLLYEMPHLDLQQLVSEAGNARHRIGQAHTMGSRALCICVPTTSGTGAEVTPFAVIRDTDTGRKVTLADYALTPSMAVVDPQLVMGLPAEQTAYGGMLTLAHALESYVSVFASDFSRGLSKHAMTMMLRYYERAYRNGPMDYHAREKMHNAATVAGLAFSNTYLGICHALASEISATCGIHLGLASALLLVPVMEFVAKDPAAKAALAELADHLHVGGTTEDEKLKNVITWVQSMKAAADIPSSIPTALTQQAHETLHAKMEEVCRGALENAHMMAAPVQPSLEDLKAIIMKAAKAK